MKVAIFARNSSTQQQPTSTKDQIYICKEFAAARNWLVVEVSAAEGIAHKSVTDQDQ
jgi:DNA invertase Pin-like site-specific DNA recombinase